MSAVEPSRIALVDTHAHLDDRAFDADRAAVLQRAADAGVAIVTVGVNLESSEAAVRLAAQNQHVYAAVGVHPHDAVAVTPQTMTRLRALCREPKVVAIGETGLDWYRHLSPRQAQLDAFAAQLDLAAEVGLPVIVHNRDADEDVLRVLTEHAGVRGVLHAFAANQAFADAAQALGLRLGMGGPLTYKNAQARRDVAARARLDCLLLETDCPWLPPVPLRGRRNEPAYVALVAQELAAVRGVSADEIAKATTRNAARLFGLAGATAAE